MSRALALKSATFQKARKAQMVIDRAAEAERRRKQYDWDHFEPDVWGQADPSMSQAEYDAIIERARLNKQNVFFGEAWRNPQHAAQWGGIGRNSPAPPYSGPCDGQTYVRNPVSPTPEVDPFAWIRPILRAFRTSAYPPTP